MSKYEHLTTEELEKLLVQETNNISKYSILEKSEKIKINSLNT